MADPENNAVLRARVLESADELPGRSAETIFRRAEEKSRELRLTIHLPESAALAIGRASDEEEIERAEIALNAILQWLRDNPVPTMTPGLKTTGILLTAVCFSNLKGSKDKDLLLTARALRYLKGLSEFGISDVNAWKRTSWRQRRGSPTIHRLVGPAASGPRPHRPKGNRTRAGKASLGAPPH